MGRRIVNDIERIRGENVALRSENMDWQDRYARSVLENRKLQAKLQAIETARKMRGGK